MEQISATVRQTTDHKPQATRIASHNATVAGRGDEVIRSMVRTVEDIQASSGRIGDITALQTNFPALNPARVEATAAAASSPRDQARGLAAEVARLLMPPHA